jgi:hypothetical protein
MNTFSIFSAKVLLCAVAAFAPVTLLFTGLEVTTQEAAQQARAQDRALERAWTLDASARGVVVG